MRQPRPEHFQPSYKARRPEEINLADVMPLKPNHYVASEVYPTTPPNRASEPNGRTERVNRATDTIDESDRPHRPGEPNGRTALRELDEGIPDDITRKTQRYSFEIYLDQKDGIEEFQMVYRQRTGRKISASRIIREALDAYLSQASQKTP
ncbi:MAG: hypothetical protein H0T73_00115 [Ardenticatenales bacterium]|nr:hypothetical protein [Ardenticatenales bacterium]